MKVKLEQGLELVEVEIANNTTDAEVVKSNEVKLG